MGKGHPPGQETILKISTVGGAARFFFDAHLDRAFAVKNIKDGAQPLPELMDVHSKRQLLAESGQTAT